MATYDPSTDAVVVQTAPDDSWTTALDTIAPTFTQKLADTTAPGTDWVTSAQQLMTALVMSDTQRRLLNIQIDRASKGLPPLDASQYSAGVNVGLAPETQSLLKWAVLGVGTLVALAILKPGRG